jgi:hypothetical protein
MKKTIFVLLVSVYLLNGCHPNNTPSDNSTSTMPTADTTKAHAISPQPIDTSIKKDGEVIKKYPNGIIKEKSNYVAGRRQGECQSFYSNGKLQSDDFFTGGLMDGSTIVYYDNGQKEYEGNCTKGKPYGVWKFYNNTGKLVRTKDYGKVSTNPAM